MKYFFSSLVPSIIRSFTGRRIWLHLIAIIATYIIVVTGFDWLWFLSVRGELLSDILSPAIGIGALIPIVIPLSLFVTGWILDKKYYRSYSLYGAALGQAALIGSIISSAYKAFTGRIQPDIHNLIVDGSRLWNFGFWEHGVFWGWPSSHTTVAFAMVFCLIYMTGRNKPIMISALIYGFYIGLGVSLRIHWFSEFVAGAFIGAAIGIAVGKVYRMRLDQKRGEK
ncbi:MAG: hypothetical protein RLY57_678 [Candidatus Parcubacteria bacterium]|jgi:membrane-associated phospholipid phosphatase